MLRWFPHALLVPLLLLFLAACGPSGPAPREADVARQADEREPRTDSAEQISRYIRCIFQDRDGVLWFGTTTDGVVRYDGRSLEYFNASNGFGSDWVNAIAQDVQGDIWFATRDGAVRYNGNAFVRYTTKDGLASDHIWSLLVQRDGELWFGTYEGVTRSDGRTFSPFPLPAAELSAHPYHEDANLVNAIVEDRAGAVWFATKGGAYRYTGTTLTRFSKSDGLCDDFVNTLLEDRDGRMWFGTQFGGLCSYDGTAFNAFTHADWDGENIGTLYQLANGTLWIGERANGLCSYDTRDLRCFDTTDGEGIRVVFCMLEDDQGRTWVGTGAGLYRYEGGRFVNITKRDLE